MKKKYFGNKILLVNCFKYRFVIYTILIFHIRLQIERYNALMIEIRERLVDLEKGIQGLVVMTMELENIFQCIFDGRVPPTWLKVII